MIAGLSALIQRKRIMASISVAMLLAILFGVGVTSLHGQNANAGATGHAMTAPGKISNMPVSSRSVDLSKAPTISGTSSQNLAHPGAVNRPLSAAQRNKVRNANHTTPTASAPASMPRSTSAKFVGGGTTPMFVGGADGINSTQSGGWYPPDQAIGVGGGCCASNQYVVEGVNNAIAIYNTTYTLKAGPYSTSTLFGPLSGDFLSDPQITYDATRVAWVIAEIELHPNGLCGSCIDQAYIDLAISKNNSPLGVPTNYRVFRFTLNPGTDGMCDYPTLGMEYWNLYITCPEFATTTTSSPGGFIGNRVFAFNKTALYTGSGSIWVAEWANLVNTLDCGGGANTCPAFRISPAIEDGVPQAEWIAATDAGYGVNTPGIVLWSITNPAALNAGNLPTATGWAGNLPLSYADGVGAQQPGTSALLDPGAGVKQFMYKGGSLWFSLVTAINWNGDNATRDGILWVQVHPYLDAVATHNPQHAAGWDNNQAAYWGYVGAYVFMPTIMASDEGDAALVFNYSSSATSPSIAYTGRQNADAANTMGQGNSFYAVVGSNSNDSGRWGDYSACALNIQFTTRGFIYCAGEYGGANTSLGGFGWNTRMYTLRME